MSPVSANLYRVEFNLNLNIRGQCKQSAAHFFDHHLFGLQQVVDIGIIAIPLIRQNVDNGSLAMLMKPFSVTAL